MRDSLTSHKVLILFLNSGHPLWGKEVIEGTQVPSGTVYPLLVRFEEEGMIRQVSVARDGNRPRTYFALTAKGKAEAVRRRDQLQEVVEWMGS